MRPRPLGIGRAFGIPICHPSYSPTHQRSIGLLREGLEEAK
jgi:hypothetical protein